MGGGGLLLGIVGAFGSYNYDLVFRVILWLGICGVAGIIAITIEYGLVRFGARWRSMIAWWAALTLGLALAMVPVIFALNVQSGEPIVSALARFTRNSFAISAVLTAARLAIGLLIEIRSAGETGSIPRPSETKTHDAVAAPQQATRPALSARLAPALQDAPIQALKSEGHYVRVIIPNRSELVLMRFADAVAEMDGRAGMQVHRSWWIARDAIADSRVREGRLEVRIDDEIWAPVSRTYRSDLRETGWI